MSILSDNLARIEREYKDQPALRDSLIRTWQVAFDPTAEGNTPQNTPREDTRDAAIRKLTNAGVDYATAARQVAVQRGEVSLDDMTIGELRQHLASLPPEALYESSAPEHGTEDEFVQALEQNDAQREQRNAEAQALREQAPKDVAARDAALKGVL